PAVQVDPGGASGPAGRFGSQESGGAGVDGNHVGRPESDGLGAWGTRVQDPEDRVVEIAVTRQVCRGVPFFRPTHEDAKLVREGHEPTIDRHRNRSAAAKSQRDALSHARHAIMKKDGGIRVWYEVAREAMERHEAAICRDREVLRAGAELCVGLCSVRCEVHALGHTGKAVVHEDVPVTVRVPWHEIACEAPESDEPAVGRNRRREGDAISLSSIRRHTHTRRLARLTVVHEDADAAGERDEPAVARDRGIENESLERLQRDHTFGGACHPVAHEYLEKRLKPVTSDEHAVERYESAIRRDRGFWEGVASGAIRYNASALGHTGEPVVHED